MGRFILIIELNTLGLALLMIVQHGLNAQKF